MVEYDPERMKLAIQSGVFDAKQAAAFLNFPSVASFHQRRREFKMKGRRLAKEWRYSREMLETLRQRVFGLDYPGSKAATRKSLNG